MKQIPLSQGLVALVDDADYARLSQFRWRVNRKPRTNYAQCEIGTHTQLMHRMILGLALGDGITSDHRDRNGLNNQRFNLRTCTRAENARNKSSSPGSTSRYLGVSFCKTRCKWQVQSRLPLAAGQGRPVFLGRFDTEEDAARAYDRFAQEHFGAFANPNFPTEGDGKSALMRSQQGSRSHGRSG